MNFLNSMKFVLKIGGLSHSIQSTKYAEYIWYDQLISYPYFIVIQDMVTVIVPLENAFLYNIKTIWTPRQEYTLTMLMVSM